MQVNIGTSLADPGPNLFRDAAYLVFLSQNGSKKE